MPQGLIGGEHPSWIVGQGSTCQALKSCWRWRCRGDAGHGTISLSSHIGVTSCARWTMILIESNSACNIGSLSWGCCLAWWRHNRVVLATTLPSRCRPRSDVAIETCWWRCYRVALAMVSLCRCWPLLTRVWRPTLKQWWLVLTRIITGCHSWSNDA
jgi:hypothetical protein